MDSSEIKKKEQIFIPKTTIKRLLTDVKNIIKNPLDDNGIHYIHDETDILKGYALIIGPDDTLYEGGCYLFEFNFPSDYPFSPPLLKFKTNNGFTRFNPNLYKNSKVCVSILNTWSGEQWSSCQTISTILLVLVSLLNNTPLLNEPGVTKYHRDYNNYNKIIQYENLNFAIKEFIKIESYPKGFKPLHKIYIEYLKKDNRFSKILEKIDKYKIQENTEEIAVGIYGMNILINYKKLFAEFKKIKLE